MSNDTAGHPQIDFAWGNIPMQPNDERGVNVLDPILDSHEIAYLGWNGFPAYVPNTTHTNAAGSGSGGSASSITYVPQVVGFNLSQVNDAFGAAGLQYITANVTDGATIENNYLVASQSTYSGTAVPRGTIITLGVYSFTIPPLPVDWRPWVIAGSGAIVVPSLFPYASYNPDFLTNPTDYVVVISGIRNNYGVMIDGTYPVTGISQSGPNANVNITGLTLPYGQTTLVSSEGHTGTITIQHV